MTREEAIYELKNAAWLGTDHSRARTEEAVEMAIQALSQEPCTDAVSREAVLDALLDYWHDIQFVDGSGYDVYEDCKAVIDELPSVTQKSETVTEFADRCRECGAKYGKLLKQKSEKWIDGVHAMGYREGYKDAQKQKSGKCKTCKYWQDNNNGYPSDMCKWRTDETPDADDFCSEFEPQESEEQLGFTK